MHFSIFAGCFLLYCAVECPPGTHHVMDGCTVCEVGRYSNKSGHEFCEECPEGHSTFSTGAVSLLECTSTLNGALILFTLCMLERCICGCLSI